MESTETNFPRRFNCKTRRGFRHSPPPLAETKRQDTQQIRRRGRAQDPPRGSRWQWLARKSAAGRTTGFLVSLSAARIFPAPSYLRPNMACSPATLIGGLPLGADGEPLVSYGLFGQNAGGGVCVEAEECIYPDEAPGIAPAEDAVKFPWESNLRFCSTPDNLVIPRLGL